MLCLLPAPPLQLRRLSGLLVCASLLPYPAIPSQLADYYIAVSPRDLQEPLPVLRLSLTHQFSPPPRWAHRAAVGLRVGVGLAGR